MRIDRVEQEVRNALIFLAARRPGRTGEPRNIIWR